MQDFLDRVLCRDVVTKCCAERVSDGVRHCSELVRELSMIRDGLLVFSDHRLSVDDASVAIRYLCTE